MEQRSNRRRRLAPSCVECRRRKIKCDRNDPCTHCISVKVPCTFKFYRNEPATNEQPLQDTGSGLLVPAATDGSTAECGNQASIPKASSNDWARQTDVESLDTDREGLLCGPRDVINRVVGCNDASSTPGDEVRPSNYDQGVLSAVQDLFGRVQRLERSSTPGPTHVISEATMEPCKRSSGPDELDAVLDKARSLGRNHPKKIPKEVLSVSVGQSLAGTAFCRLSLPVVCARRGTTFLCHCACWERFPPKQDAAFIEVFLELLPGHPPSFREPSLWHLTRTLEINAYSILRSYPAMDQARSRRDGVLANRLSHHHVRLELSADHPTV